MRFWPFRRRTPLTERFALFHRLLCMTGAEIAALPAKSVNYYERQKLFCDPAFVTIPHYWSKGAPLLNGEFGHDDQFRYIFSWAEHAAQLRT